MPLTRPTYDVWLNPVTDLETPDHTVAITTGDQMRAELEARAIKLPPLEEAKLNGTALWIWAACVRLGYTEAKSLAFLHGELGEWMPHIEPDQDQAGVETVDPTVPGPSGDSDSG